MMRSVLSVLFGMLLVFGAVNCSEAETPLSAAPPNAAFAAAPPRMSRPAADGKEERLREGMKITQIVGRFEAAGEQVTFIRGDGKESLRALQNLALERIVQSIQEERGRYQWVVSGVITEFRGANYLLITRAVISGRDQSTANP